MPEKPGNIEHYEKCFRSIVIEEDFITRDELEKALAVQAYEEIASGTCRQIGEILLDQDVLNANQVENVVKTVLQQLS